ncbi:TfoX/Sxy family DNA transformation protein [Arenibaculum sp.]|jgi:DNA transformation protein|uniref:TfoX/Sxy family DNA transformation protein n=1 Tax=Arenibaculum sp. TaxID=2865862 RepID=UPI002E15CA5A|nr:TfoX/Sxy family DNA transformation protein [Arenibaculum sp.]
MSTGRPLHLLPNLGPATARRLAEVGVSCEADLRALGAVAAYARLRHAFPRETSLNALWALHGALEGVAWTALDAATRARLEREAAEPS